MQGQRGGGVRYRLRANDVLLIVVYMPPCLGSDSAMMAVRKILGWLEALVANMPARCETVLMLDSNGHMGLRRDADGVLAPVEDSALGPMTPPPLTIMARRYIYL